MASLILSRRSSLLLASRHLHLKAATLTAPAAQRSCRALSQPTSAAGGHHHARPQSTAGIKRRRIMLSAFMQGVIGHQSPGLWSHPEDKAQEYTNIEYWQNMAKMLEEGGFDTLFLADVLGWYDGYNGSRDAAVWQAVQAPAIDPMLIIPPMAAVTKRLGFGVTVSLTYEQPYSFARKMSTLDHLTNGRIAWNIVTSYLQSAAINLGLDEQIPHDERYNLAEEFMQVVYKLWEYSWTDDAVIRDRERRIFAEPSKVRDIKHKGKYYSVPGAHLSEPSRQRTPFLFQAGASSKGQEFAARHSEATFISGPNPHAIRRQVDGIRAKAKEMGRDPSSVKVFTLLTPVVAETEEAAQAKLADYKKYANVEAAAALWAGWSGVNLAGIPDDQPLVHVKNDSIQSIANFFAKEDKNSSVTDWTPKKLAEFLAIGGRGPVAVGTPAAIADKMEEWLEIADVDGFNLAYVTAPGTFKDFIDLVIPELRRRGRVPELNDAQSSGQKTLREIMGGKGPRLPPEHYGASFRNRGEQQ